MIKITVIRFQMRLIRSREKKKLQPSFKIIGDVRCALPWGERDPEEGEMYDEMTSSPVW